MSTRTTVHTLAFPGRSGDHSECQVVVIDGPDMGRAITLGQAPVRVGTGAECDLRLTDDRASRVHVEVTAAADGIIVRDLDSRNGTLFEGSLVTEVTVSAGATFKVGRSFLRIQPSPEPLALPPSQSRRFGELVAESLAMREVFAVLEQAAASDVTVLVEGETGTGKELAARAIHDQSGRRNRAFVAVDCAALPPGLIESALFGHVKGAFTGASVAREGAFVRAHGGTIFLDELSSIDLDTASRLLRVLERGEVRPVGSDRDRPVDVRVIAAGQNLRQLVAEGKFRPDLYYRLSVVHTELPPLRQRREDIAPIITTLLRRRGFEPGEVAGPNLDRLMVHGWPGNVRELRNVVERALALSPDAHSFSELRISVSPTSSATPLSVRSDLPFSEAKQAVIDEFERRYLADLFVRCDGNISAAAREAELDRKHLRNLLRRHEII